MRAILSACCGFTSRRSSSSYRRLRPRWRNRRINVGGRALVPPMPGIDEVPYLTNPSMMDVDFLPEHLIIVGGSYIGLDRCRRVQAATSAAIFIRGGPNGQNGRRDHPGRA